jgi:uncharacterized protein YoaH (UPF0181 family)
MVAIGVCVVYAIFKMRKIYAEQEPNFSGAISAVEEIQKLLPELLLLTQNVRSDGQALQRIALQIEVSVAELKNSFGMAVQGVAEQQASTIDDLRNHLDFQEERLVKVVEDVSERLHMLPQTESAAAEPKPPTVAARGIGSGQQIRFRKEVIREIISQEPQVRFAALKDWISTNSLAIVYRGIPRPGHNHRPHRHRSVVSRGASRDCAGRSSPCQHPRVSRKNRDSTQRDR